MLVGRECRLLGEGLGGIGRLWSFGWAVVALGLILCSTNVQSAQETDPESPKAFPEPPELSDAVGFWYLVFTRYNNDQVLLHDREHMDIVWQVHSLPLNKQGKLNPKQTTATIRKLTDALEKRLDRLAKDPTPLDEEDRTLLAVACLEPESRAVKQCLKGAAGRVRAQQGVADNFQAGLERVEPYAEAIHKILREEQIPEEMLALTFVESMFNPRARSSAGAAGAWQLMPSTARHLGLKTGRGQDERLDVLKATRAAAKMLRRSHKMLGSWPLAITAYNHGPYGVRRAVKAVGSTDLVTLIEHYKKSTWGFASKNFYAEFLAALRVLAEVTEQDSEVALREQGNE